MSLFLTIFCIRVFQLWQIYILQITNLHYILTKWSVLAENTVYHQMIRQVNKNIVIKQRCIYKCTVFFLYIITVINAMYRNHEDHMGYSTPPIVFPFPKTPNLPIVMYSSSSFCIFSITTHDDRSLIYWFILGLFTFFHPIAIALLACKRHKAVSDLMDIYPRYTTLANKGFSSVPLALLHL